MLAATGYCLGCRLYGLRWYAPRLFDRLAAVSSRDAIGLIRRLHVLQHRRKGDLAMTVPATPRTSSSTPTGPVQHIDDPNIRFVEVDVDTSAYDEGHIPGAVAWNWTSQLSDGVRRDIVSREELEPSC